MKQTEALRVRLTTDEADAFKNLADAAGETRSGLLRKAVREMVNDPYPDLLHDEQSTLRVVIRTLVGISRNLNQITTAINSGNTNHSKVDEMYLSRVQSHVDDVKKSFIEYLDITRKRKMISPTKKEKS